MFQVLGDTFAAWVVGDKACQVVPMFGHEVGQLAQVLHARPPEVLAEVSEWAVDEVAARLRLSGQAAAGSGLGPRSVGYVLGIVKAYTTRVGEGPFACELNDEVGEHLATVGREVGVNTGRARRCGWFDAVLVRQSVAINGIDGIALTKLDVLDGLKTLKICVGYRVGDRVLDYLPASLKDQAAAEPVFEELEGWTESTASARSFKDLNANAIKYVRRIEELIGAPVALLSTSPERDDTILMRDPFQD